MTTGGNTMLIVEDEAALRNALVNKFSAKGFSVSTAGTGQEGFDLALKSKPDVMLLDLVLPDKDGVDVLCELRKDAWGKDAQIVVLTNLSLDSPVRVQKMVECEPLLYLVKCDWSIAQIVEKVIELVAPEGVKNSNMHAPAA